MERMPESRSEGAHRCRVVEGDVWSGIIAVNAETRALSGTTPLVGQLIVIVDVMEVRSCSTAAASGQILRPSRHTIRVDVPLLQCDARFAARLLLLAGRTKLRRWCCLTWQRRLAIFFLRISGDRTFSSQLSFSVEDLLGGLHGLARQLQLLDNRFVLLLVPLPTHLRRGGVEELHARPDDTLQPGAVVQSIVQNLFSIVIERERMI